MNKLVYFLLVVSLGVALSRDIPGLSPESIQLKLTFNQPVQLSLHKIYPDFDAQKNISGLSARNICDQREAAFLNYCIELQKIYNIIHKIKESEGIDVQIGENNKDDDERYIDDDIFEVYSTLFTNMFYVMNKLFLSYDVAISKEDVLKLLPERFHIKEVFDMVENVEFERNGYEPIRKRAFYVDEEGKSFLILYGKMSKGPYEDFYFGFHEDEAGIWAIKPSFKEHVSDTQNIDGVEHYKILLAAKEKSK